VLPATDLYLMGRDARTMRRVVLAVRQARRKRRAVLVATNNVLNPFTPFGDLRCCGWRTSMQCRLCRYQRVRRPASDLVTDAAGRLMMSGLRHRHRQSADLVILDTDSGPNGIAELPDVLMGFKNGRQVFERTSRRCFRRRLGFPALPRLSLAHPLLLSANSKNNTGQETMTKSSTIRSVETYPATPAGGIITSSRS